MLKREWVADSNGKLLHLTDTYPREWSRGIMNSLFDTYNSSRRDLTVCKCCSNVTVHIVACVIIITSFVIHSRTAGQGQIPPATLLLSNEQY